MKRQKKKKKHTAKHYIPLTIALFCVCIVVVLWSSAQHRDAPDANKSPAATQVNTKRSKQGVNLCGSIELPAHTANNDSLVYNATGRYTMQYSPHYRSALWVAYKLTASDTKGNSGRSSKFTTDKELQSRGYCVAANSDYSKSGFDKGHLLPSADRQGSVPQNRATFILSNCTPQRAKLNRGLWKQLEEQLRHACIKYDTIYIVTGTVFCPNTKRIGKNGIAVASYFFKAALARDAESYDSLAYIMPQIPEASASIESYQVSLDSIERLTGLRLFPSVRNH